MRVGRGIWGLFEHFLGKTSERCFVANRIDIAKLSRVVCIPRYGQYQGILGFVDRLDFMPTEWGVGGGVFFPFFSTPIGQKKSQIFPFLTIRCNASFCSTHLIFRHIPHVFASQWHCLIWSPLISLLFSPKTPQKYQLLLHIIIYSHQPSAIYSYIATNSILPPISYTFQRTLIFSTPSTVPYIPIESPSHHLITSLLLRNNQEHELYTPFT